MVNAWLFGALYSGGGQIQRDWRFFER